MSNSDSIVSTDWSMTKPRVTTVELPNEDTKTRVETPEKISYHTS